MGGSLAHVRVESNLCFNEDDKFERARLVTLFAGSALTNMTNATTTTTTNDDWRRHVVVEAHEAVLMLTFRASRCGSFAVVVRDVRFRSERHSEFVVLPLVDSARHGPQLPATPLRVADLVLQTVVTKAIGSLRDAIDAPLFAHAHQLGVNAIHFTPLEKLGMY